ncbi:MAG TPA: ATP synthase F0 subunit C [Gemmataceae bacterium]|nr:ATP synthase F0 subunit C [Gemmataceae bacterium]
MKISKLVRVAVLSLAALLVTFAPAMAQDKKGADPVEVAKATGPTSVSFGGAGLAAGIGMGLTIIGAGLGLGKIGSAALEGMARQPEVAARIQTAMLIIAAMLEGATLASVILCFLVGNKATF